MSKTARLFRRAVLIVGLGWLALYLGVIPFWLSSLAVSRRFAYPDHENADLTPGSFDLPFSGVSFPAPDGVLLAGWWVSAPRARGSVVLVHGLNRSRIEMVRKLPFLHQQGWNVLLFDLRRHGESGGEASSLGYFEREDVRAAAAWARSRAPGPVVTWGVSLGAAAAALAAAEDPQIGGLVCDSSYRSLRDTVRHHLELFRNHRFWLRVFPTRPIADLAVYWIGFRVGFDPGALDVVRAAHRLAGRPCLFVCNSGDRRMPPEIAFELKTAVGQTATVLVIPGDSHGGAYRQASDAYQAAVCRVLRTASENWEERGQ